MVGSPLSPVYVSHHMTCFQFAWQFPGSSQRTPPHHRIGSSWQGNGYILDGIYKTVVLMNKDERDALSINFSIGQN